MSQFATAEELNLYTGRAGKPTEIIEDRANLLLRLATARVQQEARQRLEIVEDDLVQLHPQQEVHEINLPELPVISVASVVVVFANPSQTQASTLVITNYEVTTWGRVRWPLGEFTGLISVAINAPIVEADYPPLIEVTYTHGFDPIPDEIRGVVLASAARAAANPEGFMDERIGSYQASYGESQGLALTQDEKDMIRDVYRKTVFAGVAS